MMLQFKAAEEMAAFIEATAVPLQPRTLQVQDSTGKANDAAVHSPLGDVAIGDHPATAETAPKLQAVAEVVEKHRADEMAASDLQGTGNMPPEAQQLGDVASKYTQAADAEAASGLVSCLLTLIVIL